MPSRKDRILKDVPYAERGQAYAAQKKRDQYARDKILVPTAEKYREAAREVNRLEDAGEKPSTPKVAKALGWPGGGKKMMPPPVRLEWMEDENFQMVRQTLRLLERAESLPGAAKLLDALGPTAKGIITIMAARVSEHLAGIKEIPDSILFRDGPKIVSLLGEARGEVERAGININVLNQHVDGISDPERRDAIFSELAARLKERYESEASRQIEAATEDAEFEELPGGRPDGGDAQRPESPT